MITFDLNDLEEDKLYWLHKNVGHGGRWLNNRLTLQVEPEDGDEWGYYLGRAGGWYKISFLDEKKAMLYSLRWS
jgi:hypothetical protein